MARVMALKGDAQTLFLHRVDGKVERVDG